VTVEEHVVARAVHVLDALGIPYMIAGSMASTVHGLPRTTYDADIVIDPAPGVLARLVDQLSEAGFYVNLEAARRALSARRQFNAIDAANAFKVDLIIRKERPFSRQELERRQRVQLGEAGLVALATAEDTVLSKLEWAKEGGRSERQLADVRGILDLNGAALDRVYIERWAKELGVLELWREVAGNPEPRT